MGDRVDKDIVDRIDMVDKDTGDRIDMVDRVDTSDRVDCRA